MYIVVGIISTIYTEGNDTSIIIKPPIATAVAARPLLALSPTCDVYSRFDNTITPEANVILDLDTV